MSYFVSKIGHLDPRFYSLIYCAIPGVQMSRVQMSGVRMSGSRCRGSKRTPLGRMRCNLIFSQKEQDEPVASSLNSGWWCWPSQQLITKHQITNLKSADFNNAYHLPSTVQATVDGGDDGAVDGGRYRRRWWGGRYCRRWPVGRTVGRTVAGAIFFPQTVAIF